MRISDWSSDVCSSDLVEQGVLERVPHVEIKMIGRLVEQQQVRPAINHQRQRQACLFATGERFDLLHRTVAAEVEAAEEVAQRLIAGEGIDTTRMQHCRSLV